MKCFNCNGDFISTIQIGKYRLCGFCRDSKDRVFTFTNYDEPDWWI